VRRHAGPFALAALAAAALIGAAVTFAIGASRDERDDVAPASAAGIGTAAGIGMMGGGMMGGGGAYGGMMGGGTAPADPVGSMPAAAERVDGWLADAGLDGFRAVEVMAFSNGYYVAVEDTDGQGALELLVDPATGSIGPEPGPNMMWNTTYGMMGGRVGGMMGGSTMGAGMGGMMGGGQGRELATPLSGTAARELADRWLERLSPGETAGEPRAFPGYYTLDTERSGETVGMLSVNARSGAVWYHVWHGRFLDELER